MYTLHVYMYGGSCSSVGRAVGSCLQTPGLTAGFPAPPDPWLYVEVSLDKTLNPEPLAQVDSLSTNPLGEVLCEVSLLLLFDLSNIKVFVNCLHINC